MAQGHPISTLITPGGIISCPDSLSYLRLEADLEVGGCRVPPILLLPRVPVGCPAPVTISRGMLWYDHVHRSERCPKAPSHPPPSCKSDRNPSVAPMSPNPMIRVWGPDRRSRSPVGADVEPTDQLTVPWDPILRPSGTVQAPKASDNRSLRCTRFRENGDNRWYILDPVSLLSSDGIYTSDGI